MAELQRVDAQFFGQFVNDGFRSKGGVGATRGAIGAGLGAVDDHIIAVDLDILQPIGGQDHASAGANGGARVGAGFIDHFRFGGGDDAVLGCAHLDANVRAGGRAGGLEHFGA